MHFNQLQCTAQAKKSEILDNPNVPVSGGRLCPVDHPPALFQGHVQHRHENRDDEGGKEGILKAWGCVHLLQSYYVDKLFPQQPYLASEQRQNILLNQYSKW